ncbi:TetR family transcriptional regulator [Longispora fulva]|uniref:AcrR family transcriptional regulator n=1 Tax=Longispora fulva TaxID=619741 RepID=A0A8J7GAI3_9ACTN|nr:TetR/AcrR family transcriptional regulator [Longispora fulva]MBG6135430.1 AcrR family transcriptional regulator [Longispora fulva]GIG56327.1 TetR family transcriptional regulator [Longispora fulva]
MSIHARRERERTQRHELIVTAARELAEAEGWEAVTTRRLADRIEYSQPVLYSHFSGKDAIVAAVAVRGFAELAGALAAARGAGEAGEPGAALAAVARAYVDFAHANPALYDAMFSLATDLPFGGPDAPEALREAFGQLLGVFVPLAGDRDAETFTEVGWSALHGLVTLTRGGRLRPDLAERRLTILVDQLSRP